MKYPFSIPIPPSLPADMDFCTLGMLILDDIEYRPPKSPMRNVLGGAGSYAALGARLVSPPPLSRRIGWVVHCGSDFPDPVRETIDSWDTACVLVETPDRLTTRGWNGYGENENRAFKYLTPKLRISHTHLPPAHLLSSSFHLICSASRCIHEITNILLDRRNLHPGTVPPRRPIFVWEPVPDLCIESEFANLSHAARLCDVISPNHDEIAALFGLSDPASSHDDSEESSLDRDRVERQALDLLAICTSAPTRTVQQTDPRLPDGLPLPLPNRYSIVVRSGKDGSFTASAPRQRSATTLQPTDSSANTLTRWLPAYHSDPTKVIDPTGAGNTFLGALCISLARGGDITTAVVDGTVAASFAIEQVGVPVLEPATDPERERWNGSSVSARLEEFKTRVGV